MSYLLRPYQQQAVNSTVEYFRQSDQAAVIVLPTGAGKSLVIAELGRIAKRRILVLAHVKELVEQNHDKYQSYGFTASIFSAGLNRKENDSQVVFGSVQSISRNLDAFNDEFSLLIIDECHRVSTDENSQYQQVIKHLQQHNKNLKVLGLTATPYRLDTGWIYQQHLQKNCIRSNEKTAFTCCIYELSLGYMIDNGFLTPATLLDAPIALYNFEQLRPSSNGHYREVDLDQVIQKSQRATARIIEQIIATANDPQSARQGVMIFAATVRHAKEIINYLPPSQSAIIIGDMKARARDSVIKAFKAKQIKFLVNVSVLTTGFDAPHVDLIAMLRPTESVSLYQQIIGRGLRLSADKKDCLIVDYAGNNHDLFRPQIAEIKPDSDSEIVDVNCPSCKHSNQFWGRYDQHGKIIEHFGRRCQGLVIEPLTQQKVQCDFRFKFKECPQCGSENDIAARQCHYCEGLLVDPDQKLKQALQLKDAKVLRCSGMSFEAIIGKQSQPLLKISYHDEDGAELQEYFSLKSKEHQHIFYHQFIKIHSSNRGLIFKPTEPSEVVLQQHIFRAPDFVIARKQGRFWQVKEKIFDYQGRYRRANEIA